MDYNVILIRYGEIGLKSEQVRKRIEQILKKNIHFKLKKKIKTFEIKILPARGRIFIYTDEVKKASRFLTKIFGISSFSPALECSSELTDIKKTALDVAARVIKPGDSFALKTRRSGSHEYSSKEVSEQIGTLILDHFGRNKIKVNLSKPNKTIFIEIRDKFCYIFDKKIKGLGGFPYGTQNKLLALISNEYSLISTWLMLRKGCEIMPVFLLEEGLTKKSKNLIWELVNSIKKYLPLSKLLVYFIDIQELISYYNLKEIIYFLLNNIIEKENVLGLVTSEQDVNEIISYKNFNAPVYRPILFLNIKQIEKFQSMIPLKIKLNSPMVPNFKDYKQFKALSEQEMGSLNLEKIITKKLI